MITITKNGDYSDLIKDGFSIKNYQCKIKVDNRFPDDKVFVQTEKYILVLDGIVLNKKEILRESREKTWKDCLLKLYQEKGEQFFACLKGSFVGALYDINQNKWIIFRDQLGGRPVYYYNSDKLHVSTDIANLYQELKQSGVSLHLDGCGVQMILDYGITIDGYTICQEVRRVHPGCYLVFENDRLLEKKYYEIKLNTVKLSSEDDYLDMIEDAYKEAVRRQFAKDDEYGYKTITCLSGGIDSRMMVWTAHQLGWKKQLNITFSNSGWYDETTARRIAKDLHHEWLFKSLDDAQFMYNVDESTNSTGGNQLFTGVLHGRTLTQLVDYEGNSFGSLHTGSQGEILKGEAVCNGSINKNGNRYLNYLQGMGISSILDYSDPEIATIINKYLFIAQNTSLSPLLEVDFFETTLKIPAELRKDEYIYKQWVCKRHPDANKYVWATTGLPYGSKRFNPVLPIVHCYLHQFPKYIKYKLGYGGYGMNPWGQFYNSDEGIKAYYDNYQVYLEAIEDKELRNKVNDYFNSPDLIRRFKAISVLSAIKLYFS